MKKSITIATRASPLALAQTKAISEALLAHHPELQIEILPMVSEGDKNLSLQLNAGGGKGLFTKELENSLASGQADLAVHSMKDVPMYTRKDFFVTSALKREASYDVLVTPLATTSQIFFSDCKIGTSSLRRQTQLKKSFPNATVVPIRGNLGTRLAQLDKKQVDAITLAQAGINRLSLSLCTHPLPLENHIPSPGQGIIAIETRLDDSSIKALIIPLQDPDTVKAYNYEEYINKNLEGDCLAPIGIYASMISPDLFSLSTYIGDLDNHDSFTHTSTIRTSQESNDLDSHLITLHSLGAKSLIQKAKNFLANSHV
ncbi:MAG: hydroxymethylbilane synthase [Methylacidiphilales bacterium]|nr:hydroxymethylbilane synthase [Candidatus Methylacidiphilales bacterium]